MIFNGKCQSATVSCSETRFFSTQSASWLTSCFLTSSTTRKSPTSKGGRFLGRIIKGDRIYVDNRTIHRAEDRICDFNDIHDELIHIEEFISSINSTLGLLKTKNEFKNIQKLVARISPKWWDYVDMDWNRLCIVAKEGYKHKDIVNFKFNKLWNRLNSRSTNRKPL